MPSIARGIKSVMRLAPCRALIADPPWRFGDSLPGLTRGASNNYPTLTVAQICKYPLPPIQDNALLFLWRVASMQQEALDVAKAWGFVPKTEIVWVKKTVNGKRWFGMGRIVRAEHETCLVCKRGRGPEIRLKNVRSTFEAQAGAHSAKPDEFRRIVEQLTDGPYTELFARSRWQGWQQSGWELPRYVPVVNDVENPGSQAR